MKNNFSATTCEWCNKAVGEVVAFRKQPEFRVNESPVYLNPFYVCRECFDSMKGDWNDG